MITRPVFDDIIGKLSDLFNYKLKPAQKELYYKHLSQTMADAEFNHAAQDIVLNTDVFPTVAAFIRADQRVRYGSF